MADRLDEDEIREELTKLRAEIAVLRERISRLEQGHASHGHSQTAERPDPIPPLAQAPAVPPQRSSRLQLLTLAKASPSQRDQLESQIGKLWLNRIGIIAILTGASYFISYAFDSGWIGPKTKIASGLLAGIGLMLWSERLRAHGQAPFSYALKALGLGMLYLSVWGAFQSYHLISVGIAFAAMVVISGMTVWLSLRQDSEVLAFFAMIGGFSTPLLLSTVENHEAVLFTYVCILNVAILAIVAFKPWPRLQLSGFLGTTAIYIAWFSEYYTNDQRTLTTAFLLAFAAIFAGLAPLNSRNNQPGPSRSSIFFSLPLLNATAAFLALRAMDDDALLGWFALGLGAFALALSSQFERIAQGEAQIAKSMKLLHAAIGIVFFTLAIPLELSSNWITLGWLVESSVLLCVAMSKRIVFALYFAAVILGFGIVRLLMVDDFHVRTLIFNARFGEYLFAIAILAGIILVCERLPVRRQGPWKSLASIALNLLAVIALSEEVSSYFGVQLADWMRANGHQTVAFQQIEFALHLSYSVVWLAYGAGLMMFGFWRRSAFVRWQALVLIALTVAKVFLFDTSGLEQGYRIVSFIALGVVLMGISYVYHRDWLKLTGPVRPEES